MSSPFRELVPRFLITFPETFPLQTAASQFTQLSTSSYLAVVRTAISRTQTAIMIYTLVFGLCFHLAFSSARSPEIKVLEGIVRGVERETIWGTKFDAFYGIPFAKPPVGDLRFKRPVPAEPWVGIWNATEPPNECLQGTWNVVENTEGDNWHIGQEDCLYVNVFIPTGSNANSEPLDVLVFIHGGGFNFFTSYYYGPEYILERNIVYVTFNYRLGTLGFLSLEDEMLPGNLGLWDQNLALKWTKKNIALFGGNPEKITIAGMSAGAASVHYHLLSKQSKGLFNKAILNSGAAFNPWALSLKPRETALKIASALGCSTNSSVEIVECLNQRPSTAIIRAEANLWVYRFLPTSQAAPVVEKPGPNAFIDKQPYDIVKNGEMNDVPTLWSYDSEEGLLFSADIIADKTRMVEKNWGTLGPVILEYKNTADPKDYARIAHQIWDQYMGERTAAESPEAIGKLFGDRYFYIGINDAIQAHAVHGSAPQHLYQFSYVGEKRFSDQSGIHSWYKGGACHGDDTHYVLRASYMPVDGNPQSEKMIKTLTDIWMDFIQGTPSWEPAKTAGFPNITYLDVVCSDPANNEVKTLSPTSGQLMWKSLSLAEYSLDNIETSRRQNDEL